MPDPKPLSRSDGLDTEASEAKPLRVSEQMTAKHLNGRCQTVLFETISGDALDQVRIRWPLAGFYDVDIDTGKLLGGGRKKGRKSASVWSIVPSDMARVRATQRQMRIERRERMRKNKASC